MKQHITSADTVIDLHDKGFTNDFQLYGNELLWVQEGVFVRASKFAILKYHKIASGNSSTDEDIVVGIIAPYPNVKGILLNQYKQYTDKTPPVLLKKLNELNHSIDTKLSGMHTGINCNELL